MTDLNKLKQQSAQYLNRNSYYKGLNTKNAQNLAIVESYMENSQSIFSEYKQQCQDLNSSVQDALADYETAQSNYNYSKTEEAKELLDAAKERYIMLSQKAQTCEAEKAKIEKEVLDLRCQKDSMVEDKKITEQEIEWTGQQLEKIDAEIKKAEQEIKEAREYSDNAAGSCQKGIDVIFGTDGSKKTKPSSSSSKSYDYSSSYSQTRAKESTKDKKTNNQWWSASRDFNQNLFK